MGKASFILISLCIALLLITQSIVQGKLYQLRLSVSQERLMNFELSSRVLRARLRQIFENPDNYKAEIQRNLIESAVLNNADASAELNISFLAQLGLAVSNSVRLMSLKPILRLQQNRAILLLGKYAFFMERNRHFTVAVEKYTEIIERSQGEKTDIVGFSLLHKGYCLLILGQYKEAASILEQVRDDYPGTHYGQAGVLLLSLLSERQALLNSIQSKKLSRIEKARRYYKSGLYQNACSLFQLITHSSAQDRYRYGRCNEEIGKRKKAIRIYESLIKDTSHIQTAKLANRRLLFLGYLYNAGESVAKKAQKNALLLKDQNFLKDIKTAKKKQHKAVVIEEITDSLKKQAVQLEGFQVQQDSDIEQEFLKKLGRELTQNTVLAPNLKTILLAKQKASSSEDAGKQVLLPSYIQVQLKDGRLLRAQSLLLQEDHFLLKKRRLPLRTYVAVSLLERLESKRPKSSGLAKPIKADFMQIYVQGGERLQSRIVRFFPEEQLWKVGPRSYALEELKEIRIP